jgi:4-alpha-glucanotransferase
LNTNGSEIHWDLIREVLASVADTAVVPLQDLLGLGTEARMNLPNSTKGNWTWRFQEGDLTDKHSARLRELTDLYGRIARPSVETIKLD